MVWGGSGYREIFDVLTNEWVVMVGMWVIIGRIRFSSLQFVTANSPLQVSQPVNGL